VTAKKVQCSIGRGILELGCGHFPFVIGQLSFAIGFAASGKMTTEKSQVENGK
jgi:hypothetical protein